MAKGKFIVIVTENDRTVKREKCANAYQAEQIALAFERRFPNADNIEVRDNSKHDASGLNNALAYSS